MNPVFYFIIADLLADDEDKFFTGRVSEKEFDIFSVIVLIVLWAIIIASAIVVI